ncbi:dehydrogenase/reductase SDR family member 4-like [Daktulosphaira vitifoliae]|uniref:dehydrogenase/reductase SDR family member 4-like n=1 Tax=Daktulosphaira vitifoliae TaxID=58002 RepID=UPI0021AA5A6E|nr:dehydrogenase/reductase SDR family member 4-like [Daktulosphaira vitifoliae]
MYFTSLIRKTPYNNFKVKISKLFRKMYSNIHTPLEDQIAIITASTEGIGFATAKHLVKNGASVMISSRKESNVKKAVETLQKEFGKTKVHGVVCHVSKKEDRQKLIDETVKKFGGISILVSNAATNPVSGSVLDCPDEIWDKIFDINVKSAFLLTKEIAPHIISRGGGSIVYVASISGINPMPMLGAYSVSKTALLGLTKVVAADLAVHNIRVNCVAPGIIKTKFASALTDNESLSEYLLQTMHMKRFGHPDEIGSIVSFLCSSSASYVTGEVIVASGGMTSRL